MKPYAKSIVALLGALATWGLTASEDGVYTQVEIWGAVLALSTAAGVWLVPNEPDDERGGITVLEVCLVVIAVIFVLWAFGEVPR